MSNSPASEIMNTVNLCKPHSLIYCSREPLPALSQLADDSVSVNFLRHPQELSSQGRADLGMIFDFVEHFPQQTGIELLARLRNLHCSSLWLLLPETDEWPLNLVLSLGFRRQNRFLHQNTRMTSFGYDIASYNRKRDWNSPKHWANPENWNKYRW